MRRSGIFRQEQVPGAQVITMARANEIGATVCKLKNGRLAHGPITEGTPTSVNIRVECPPGGTPVALFHTHPGGVPYPSPMDIKSTRRVGLKHLCIQQPETRELNCFQLR